MLVEAGLFLGRDLVHRSDILGLDSFKGNELSRRAQLSDTRSFWMIFCAQTGEPALITTAHFSIQRFWGKESLWIEKHPLVMPGPPSQRFFFHFRLVRETAFLVRRDFSFKIHCKWKPECDVLLLTKHFLNFEMLTLSWAYSKASKALALGVKLKGGAPQNSAIKMNHIWMQYF